MIQQLDGLVSVQSRSRRRRLSEHARIEQDHIEESILVRIEISLIMLDHIEITGPLKEEGPKIIMEDHWIEDTTKIEDILGMIIQVEMEDPLIIEDPLMKEDPWEMDDIQDTLKDKDHLDPKDLLDLKNLL